MVTLCAALSGQTQLDLRTQSKHIDFTQAPTTAPVKAGTALPGTCTTGDLFYDTDAPAGQNLYGCTAANTWNLQGDGAGGGGGVVTQKTGAGDPNGSETCLTPSASSRTIYFDTSGLETWQCVATDTWRKILDTDGTGPVTVSGDFNATALTEPMNMGQGRMQFGDEGLEYFPNGGALSRTVIPKDCEALSPGDFVSAVATDGTVTCGTPAGASSVNWGDIGGTLSSQTDLQTALDAKLAGDGTCDNSTAGMIPYTVADEEAGCSASLSYDSGLLSVVLSGIAATPTPALSIVNETASTSGAPVQYPGAILLQGTAHDTNDDVSRVDAFRIGYRPANGNTTYGYLTFSADPTESGSFTDYAKFTINPNLPGMNLDMRGLGSYIYTGNSEVIVGRWGGLGGTHLSSSSAVRFYSGAPSTSAPDTGMSRVAALEVGFGDGTSGDTSGTWAATNGRLEDVAVSALPACDAAALGTRATVNDASSPAIGSTVAGGGAAAAAVWCNGSNWTVTGI